jgi:hypothetical protein
MRSIKIVCAAALLANLAGCATLTGGTKEVISIDTPPVTQASCELINDKGKWDLSNTPGSVKVHRSTKSLQVRCQKRGYKENTVIVASDVKKMMFGNVLVGGLIGVGVDAVDGAGFKYPPHVDVPLKKIHQ